MRRLREILRVARWLGLALLALLVVYGGLSLVLPRIPVNSARQPRESGVDDVIVYVVSNGVHAAWVSEAAFIGGGRRPIRSSLHRA